MANKYSKWDIEKWVKPNDQISIALRTSRADNSFPYWFQSVTEDTLYAMNGLNRENESIPLSKIKCIEEIEAIYSYVIPLKQAGLEIPKNEWPSLLSSGQRVAVALKKQPPNYAFNEKSEAELRGTTQVDQLAEMAKDLPKPFDKQWELIWYYATLGTDTSGLYGYITRIDDNGLVWLSTGDKHNEVKNSQYRATRINPPDGIKGFAKAYDVSDENADVSIPLLASAIIGIYKYPETQLPRAPSITGYTPEPTNRYMAESELFDEKDELPDMTGFESRFEISGDISWKSPSYLLADRDLELGETLYAYAIDDEGRIAKKVAFTATDENKSRHSWPAAFANTVNTDQNKVNGSVLLQIGHLDDDTGKFEVHEHGVDCFTFSLYTETQKRSTDRLWIFGEGYRGFTTAPFDSNFVKILNIPQTPTQCCSLQVRDITTQRLYETHIFSSASADEQITHFDLATRINNATNLIKACNQGRNRAALSKGHNSLWAPQLSNLTAVLMPATWHPWASLDTDADIAADTTIRIHVHDDITGAALAGSPFEMTVSDGSKKAWPAALNTWLATANGVKDYLRIDKKTSAGRTIYTWMKINLPLRIWMTGFSVTPDAMPAIEDSKGKAIPLSTLIKDVPDGVEIELELRDKQTQTLVYSLRHSPSKNVSQRSGDAWSELSKFTHWFRQGTVEKPTDQNPKNMDELCLWIPKTSRLELFVRKASEIWNEPEPPKKHGNLTAISDHLVMEACYLAAAASLFHGNKGIETAVILMKNPASVKDFEIQKLTDRIKKDVGYEDPENNYLIHEKNDQSIMNLLNAHFSMPVDNGKRSKPDTWFMPFRPSFYDDNTIREAIKKPTSIEALRARIDMAPINVKNMFSWALSGRSFNEEESPHIECRGSFVSVGTRRTKSPIAMVISLSTSAYASGVRLMSAQIGHGTAAKYNPVTMNNSRSRPSKWLEMRLHLPKDYVHGNIIGTTRYMTANSLSRQSQTLSTLSPLLPLNQGTQPEDTLCADYCTTMGSELYDVSGASSNGVDPRSGLFHAHFHIATLTGLLGAGPSIELAMHYSPTRANESAQGDGRAPRASCFDNRLRRLVLSNGQTVTLSPKDMYELASDKTKILETPACRISNAEADGAVTEKYTCLKSMTVTWPSGLSEVIGKPQSHDELEGGESYKNAWKTKVDKIRSLKKKEFDYSWNQVSLFFARINPFLRAQWSEQGRDSRGMSAADYAREAQARKEYEALGEDQKEMARKPFLLAPLSITSPEGETLSLEWKALKGHVMLTSIKDQSTKATLLKADVPTEIPLTGPYTYTYQIWPETDEAYSVALDIADCRLNSVTYKRNGLTEKIIYFCYRPDPILDWILISVRESDGSTEQVDYMPGHYAEHWDVFPKQYTLPQVLNHTVSPGSDQKSIVHDWSRICDPNLRTVVSRETLSADGLATSYTERTWIITEDIPLKKRMSTPLIAREVASTSKSQNRTTSYFYRNPSDIKADDDAVIMKLATSPVKILVE